MNAKRRKSSNGGNDRHRKGGSIRKAEKTMRKSLPEFEGTVRMRTFS